MPHVGAEGFCFRLFNRVRSTYKFFRWLDSNSRSLVLEATALPTAPHRCPTILHLKNGPTPASFPFIFSLFKQTTFLQQINVKKCHVHPVYDAGIRTHDLLNMSLLSYPPGLPPMAPKLCENNFTFSNRPERSLIFKHPIHALVDFIGGHLGSWTLTSANWMQVSTIQCKVYHVPTYTYFTSLKLSLFQRIRDNLSLKVTH